MDVCSLLRKWFRTTQHIIQSDPEVRLIMDEADKAEIASFEIPVGFELQLLRHDN
jgi:hypothetical protein